MYYYYYYYYYYLEILRSQDRLTFIENMTKTFGVLIFLFTV